MDVHRNLFEVPAGVDTRWATAENPKGLKGGATRGNDGRKRSPCIKGIQSGQTVVLAESRGAPGTIRRIWIAGGNGTQTPELLRGMRIEISWDGAQSPAVSVPLGDFFCQSLGRQYPFENALFANPEGRSHLCWVPMPFRDAMRITITNDSPLNYNQGLWYEVDFTVGDEIGESACYFHSHWRRENPTSQGRDYEFLPTVHGRGRLLGVNFGMAANTRTYFGSWWGEGEVKVYLDGDVEYPTLCGTGTEDYVGASYGQGRFSLAYSGCPLADMDKLQFGFYRLHVPDPVFFSNEIKATIQQIGINATGYLGARGYTSRDLMAQMRGIGLRLKDGASYVDMQKMMREDRCTQFDRHDDWSSCVYFYLDKPENALPSLAGVDDRMAPSIDGP